MNKESLTSFMRGIALPMAKESLGDSCEVDCDAGEGGAFVQVIVNLDKARLVNTQNFSVPDFERMDEGTLTRIIEKQIAQIKSRMEVIE